jgi:soluble cytochrome b562
MEDQVFVKIDNYHEVQDMISDLKKKIAKAKETLDTVMQLKTEEDTEIESWKHGLDDVGVKLDSIETTLLNK